ncbi:MAG TPA: antibiotic biosynthesis monooxygenase [Candidatus Baltobacteraceae bacterium]|jgi:quinol monooxygenase YgiN|nr:antibiotic biosynthesis monooxygenase [Candidatus Baltobacteraceae bacterium]
MYARVWRFTIRSGNLENFAQAVRTLVPEAKKEQGFRGFLVLRGRGNEVKSHCMMVGLWQSRATLRQSDDGLFLPRALAHLITYCEGFPVIQENDVLVNELVADPDMATN